jgi:hypothetical protein
VHYYRVGRETLTPPSPCGHYWKTRNLCRVSTRYKPSGTNAKSHLRCAPGTNILSIRHRFFLRFRVTSITFFFFFFLFPLFSHSSYSNHFSFHSFLIHFIQIIRCKDIHKFKACSHISHNHIHHTNTYILHFTYQNHIQKQQKYLRSEQEQRTNHKKTSKSDR